MEHNPKRSDIMVLNVRIACLISRVFPCGGTGRIPLSPLCPPPSQTFPENNRESNSLSFVSNGLLLKMPPLVNLLGKTLISDMLQNLYLMQIHILLRFEHMNSWVDHKVTWYLTHQLLSHNSPLANQIPSFNNTAIEMLYLIL